MMGILFAKAKMFIRTPWMFVIFTGMSLAFAIILGGSSDESEMQVPAYAEDEAILDSLIGDELKESDAFKFNWMSEKEMTEQVANGKVEMGVKLLEDDFQLVMGVESMNANLLKQTIQQAYEKKIQQEQIVAAANPASAKEKENVRNELQIAVDSPAFTMNIGSFRGKDTTVYDNTFQTLFGFTLFFVIYTVAYNVLPILTEKTDGIWDRVILSPVKKWEMYVSNFIYSFLTGYLQVLLVFLIFRFWIGVDFHGRFGETLLLLVPYVFAIVSLSIFLTAIVKNVPQFNAILPILAVSMAMIGGAYWPIEIVESKVLIALSKINPLTYGMEVLNGVAVYGYPLEDLLYPISILLLMGVVMMGMGIHLMEKRHIQ